MLKVTLAAFVLMFTDVSLHAQMLQQGTDGAPDAESNKTLWISRCPGGTRAIGSAHFVTI